MNPRHRHAVANAFVACFAFLLATFLLAGIGQAQEKPPADTPPSPKPTTEPQKLGKELDRPEIIINSDLVTLTVTVKLIFDPSRVATRATTIAQAVGATAC